MKTNGSLKFDGALYGVGSRIGRILNFIDEENKAKIQEIRLRAEKPLAVTVDGKVFFVNNRSQLISSPSNAEKVTKSDIDEAFLDLTASSVYSHINEIKQGFIMMKNGNRAGIAGSFSEGGGITDISSINIRISREIFGVSNALFQKYSGGGVLICGGAGSGKTTLLRDFIKSLSDSGLRVSVVDSRGELSASYKGVSGNNLGVNTDVLLGFEKEKGIEIALRTLYPNIIAFDEIGTTGEAEKVKACLYGGADIITTAHLSDISDILKRSVTSKLLSFDAVKTVVMMEKTVGSGYNIYSADEVKKLCGF